jgi:predicted SAM-dependent methyltransferase
MKLNLGCGEDVKEGYIIIDIRNTKPNLLVLYLEKYLLKPLPSNSVDCVVASDCIEHISWRRIEDLLKYIYRVLKCNWRLIVEYIRNYDGTNLF